MASIVLCGVCDNRFHIPFSNRKYMDRTGGLNICSIDCVATWVERQHGRRVTNYPDIIEHKAPLIQSAKDLQKNRLAFRSTFELLFAEFAVLKALAFQYEPYTIPVGKNKAQTTYKPDFYFPEHRCFVEVKGLYYPGARKKVKNFRSIYNIPLLVFPWYARGSMYEAYEKVTVVK